MTGLPPATGAAPSARSALRLPRLTLPLSLLLAAAPLSASAQSLVELRGSTTRYRFVDFNHTFRGGLVTDLLYLGAPGANEFYLGGGYAWKRAEGLTFTPLTYAVLGKESRERGLALCANVFLDRGGWRLLAFAGRFIRLGGGVDDYDFLDAGDLTRVLGGWWEIGASGGFLHTGGEWNGRVGPTLKRSDRRGTTALSLRFGDDTELRLIRIVTF